MDTGIAAHFDELISLVRAHLTDVEVVRRDVTSRRAILELRGSWERYTIRLVEIVTPGGREYRYYVFDGTYIVAGFDNHADLSAIRLCYGADWKQHRYEPIPHLHLENKTKLELTEEMTCQQFLVWVEQSHLYRKGSRTQWVGHRDHEDSSA